MTTFWMWFLILFGIIALLLIFGWCYGCCSPFGQSKSPNVTVVSQPYVTYPRKVIVTQVDEDKRRRETWYEEQRQKRLQIEKQNRLEQQRTILEKRRQQILEQERINRLQATKVLVKPRAEVHKENIAIGSKEVNYPFKSFGVSTKEGIRMEFRLYDSKKVAMKAAKQASNGNNPVRHKPHKMGDRYHYHPKGHTIETEEGPTNIHFMYGERIYDQSLFQSDPHTTAFRNTNN